MLTRWMDRGLRAVASADERRLMAGIALLVVALRVLFYLTVFNGFKDQYGWAVGDNYDEIAKNLLAGNGYVISPGLEPNMVRTPVYVFFLVLHFLLFGQGRFSLVVVQSLLQAAACLLLYRLSRRLFADRRVSFLASLGLALYPQSMLYASQYLTESLFLLLTMIMTGTLFETLDPLRRNRRSSMILGILLGLMTLCRPVAQLLILPVAGMVAWRQRDRKRAALGEVGKIGFAFLFILSPWTIRNYAVSGDFIPVSTRGTHFLYSNTIASPVEESVALEILQRETVKGPGEEEARWPGLAVTNISRQPGRFLGNTIGTGLDFWYRGHSRAVSILDGLINFPLLALGLWGIAGVRGRGRSTTPLLVIILYFNGICSLLHAISRYSFPVIPFVLIFASLGLLRILRRFPEASADSSPAGEGRGAGPGKGEGEGRKVDEPMSVVAPRGVDERWN